MRGLWAVFVAQPLGPDSQAGSESAGTHRLVRRTVEVLHEESDRVFVKGMLRDGDRVVIDGTQRIVPGMAVRLGAPRTAANGDRG